MISGSCRLPTNNLFLADKVVEISEFLESALQNLIKELSKMADYNNPAVIVGIIFSFLFVDWGEDINLPVLGVDTVCDHGVEKFKNWVK